jgi:hypothetical protein
MRGDDNRGVIGAGVGLLSRPRLDRIAQPPRQIRQGRRDRGCADDSHGGGRKMRVQEDLQRAAAETRVLDRHRALGHLGLTLAGAGQDPQEQGLAGLHRAK